MEMYLNNARKVVVVFALIMVVCFEGCKAIDLCNMSSEDLMECKPAVSEPNPIPPSSKCCEALNKADLTCLCGYKNSSELYFLGINPDLAVALPGKCSLVPPSGC